MSESKELTELEKLRVLIPHWIEHSHSHQHEFGKWVAVAKNEGQEEAAEAIDKALQNWPRRTRICARRWRPWAERWKGITATTITTDVLNC